MRVALAREQRERYRLGDVRKAWLRLRGEQRWPGATSHARARREEQGQAAVPVPRWQGEDDAHQRPRAQLRSPPTRARDLRRTMSSRYGGVPQRWEQPEQPRQQPALGHTRREHAGCESTWHVSRRLDALQAGAPVLVGKHPRSAWTRGAPTAGLHHMQQEPRSHSERAAIGDEDGKASSPQRSTTHRISKSLETCA